MAIFLTCRCGQTYRTHDEFAGRTTSCPRCARVLKVPGLLADADEDEAYALSQNETIYSRRAIHSFLFGFCSLGLALLAGIPAMIWGVQGLVEIRYAKGRLRGVPLAFLGIVLGLIGTVAVTPLYVIPVVRHGIAVKRRFACIDNMRQIGLALHNYVSDQGRFPLPAITDGRGKPLLSWRVAILPYMGREQAALYRRFHLDEPWDGPNNSILLQQMPAVYACPDNPSRDMTVYQAMTGPGTVFPGDRAMRIVDITRGTSNTACIYEGPQSVKWSAPLDIDANSPTFDGVMSTQHMGGSNVLYADGSVR